MSCSGLHCAGCGGGSAVPVVVIGAFLGADWLLDHLIEVAALSAASGILAITGVAVLMRLADRMDGRRAVRYALLREARTVLPVTATAAVTADPRGELAGDVHVYHHHYMHGVPEASAAAIIRNALAKGDQP